MADLYRKSSLERISSPEQLDKALKVTSPMSWLALIAITLVIIVTVIWSFLGTIPETVTVRGIVSSIVGSNAIYTKEGGTVLHVDVRAGDSILFNQPIMTYRNYNNEVVTLYSDQEGTVTDIVVKKDDQVNPGTAVVRFRPTVHGNQIVVCYVPLADAKKLARGMQVNVTLDSLESQSYGHMVARIVNIDSNATSSAGMAYVLGANNQLDSLFTEKGAVVAVACELYPDVEGKTVSGYYWSTARGANVIVENSSPVTAKIVTKNVAPITKLFSKLLDLWGD